MLSRANRIKKLHKYASKASSKKAKGLNWDAAEAEIKVSDEEVSKDAILSQIAISPLFSEADIASMHAIRIEDRFRKMLNTNEAAFLEMGAFLTEKVEKLSLIGDYLVSEATKPGDITISYSIDFSNLDSIKAEFNRLDQVQEKWHQDAAEAQAAEVEEKGEFGHGYMTNDIVHDFGDGWSVVYVPAIGEGPSYKGDPWKSNDRTVEGNLNGLCLGSEMGLYQTNNEGKVYSIRDPSNKPRATVRILSDELQEVKGKSNETPDADGAVHAEKWFKDYDGLDYENNKDYNKFPPSNTEDAKAKFEEDEHSPYKYGWAIHWFRNGIPELDSDILEKIKTKDELIISSGFGKKYKELVAPVAKYYAEQYTRNNISIIFNFNEEHETSKIYKKEPWMQRAVYELFNRDPGVAFGYGLHLISNFVEFGRYTAERLAEDESYFFLSNKLQESYPELGRPIAKNLAERRPESFFHHDLHKIPEYAEFGIPAAKNRAEENPEYFFYRDLHKIPEYAEVAMLAAKNLAEKRPESFFEYGLHKIPEYAEFAMLAAKNRAEKNPEYFFYRGLHKISEYAEVAMLAAKNLAEKNPENFFYYGLHKNPEYAEFGIPAAKNWAERNPFDFFEYGLHEIPEYAEVAMLAAKNLAEKSPFDFFDLGLHEISEYAHLNPNHLNPNNEAPEENKLQSLEAWLRTNGFRREANKITLL